MTDETFTEWQVTGKDEGGRSLTFTYSPIAHPGDCELNARAHCAVVHAGGERGRWVDGPYLSSRTVIRTAWQQQDWRQQ